MWSQVGGREINKPTRSAKFHGRNKCRVSPKRRTLAPDQAKGVRGGFPEGARPELTLRGVREGYGHHSIRIRTKANGTKSAKTCPCWKIVFLLL